MPCISWLRPRWGVVVFVRGALPEVIPVCYLVAGETVVFGVHSTSPVAQEVEGSIVTFQVDSFDSERVMRLARAGRRHIPAHVDTR